MKQNKLKIAIIGYGRFGKLLTKMLKSCGQISVINRAPIRVKGIKQIEYKDLKEADWVIPAVPISALESVLKKIKPYLKPGALVMDVCSVKVMPIEWMKKILPSNVEIIGTHPMFGPDSAKYGLAGLPLIICMVRASQETVRSVVKVFKSLKLKIIRTTPSHHDKEAAKSLALVHFIGRGLNDIKIKKQEISSLGFERLLSIDETVTNDTWQLFLDMHNFNPYARATREKYIKALVSINRKLI
jgi:prephenate dehydrogenase